MATTTNLLCVPDLGSPKIRFSANSDGVSSTPSSPSDAPIHSASRLQNLAAKLDTSSVKRPRNYTYQRHSQISLGGYMLWMPNIYYMANQPDKSTFMKNYYRQGGKIQPENRNCKMSATNQARETVSQISTSTCS